MPEVDIHDVFERFRSGGPLMIPAGPDAARRTSRRRRRIRLSAAAAAAVVVAVAAPVIAYDLVSRGGTPDVGSSPTPTVATPPTTTPTATNPPSPTPDGEPTDGPAATALQRSDVPAGFRYEGDDIVGDWTLEFAAQLCAEPHNLRGLPSPEARWGATFWTGRDPESLAILQRVDQYSVADAQAYVQAVHGMAQGCVQSFGDPMTWTVENQGFAGDDSLVLRWEGGGVDNTYIVVRVAGLVTQIWYKDTDIPDPVVLGQRAAARLCEGMSAC